MSLAPTDYDFGDASNYFFATTITCANEEARAMYVRGHGHMLNYNHEQAIACFMNVTELDPTCAMGWWGNCLLPVFQLQLEPRAWVRPRPNSTSSRPQRKLY